MDANSPRPRPLWRAILSLLILATSAAGFWALGPRPTPQRKLENQVRQFEAAAGPLERGRELADVQLKQARVNLAQTEIRAPISGVVIECAVEENSFLTAGNPVGMMEDTSAVKIGLIGPDVEGVEAALELRDVAEGVLEQLLSLPSVSQASIEEATPYQIDSEISEDTLRRYDLSLQQVAELVRGENVELPDGLLRTESQEILLRGSDKRQVGAEIAQIPIVTDPGGLVLTVGDLGTVRDAFSDAKSIHRINGLPGQLLSVRVTRSEDLLERSRQAQVLIPMATSLCFGLIFSTLLVLLLVPCLYLLAERPAAGGGRRGDDVEPSPQHSSSDSPLELRVTGS